MFFGTTQAIAKVIRTGSGDILENTFFDKPEQRENLN